MMGQNVPPCSCSTPPASTYVVRGIIELRNGKICVRHNLSDLLKAPPRYDVVEADGGVFLGGNDILQKEVSDRVAKITSHNQTTTNHTKLINQVHS